MEIPEKGPLQSLPAQSRLIEAAPWLPTETTWVRHSAAEKDTVSLTERGRRFKAAADQAHSLPDIREDRVALLKRQLEDGTYRVVGDRIAMNLLNETAENNQVLDHIDTRA
ncbi:MAG: flagellar biosynthesis anti-sigma factor FlgM [Desulfobacteraceae bacterium]|jgi:flagellar biosynthesis anti-sigma factor FlgM|nr:flagellar biosynthesis anti-sigma factor FlgM [Desulfobacteraceae bacterium]